MSVFVYSAVSAAFDVIADGFRKHRKAQGYCVEKTENNLVKSLNLS